MWILVTIIISLIREPLYFSNSDLFEILKFSKLLIIYTIINNIYYTTKEMSKIFNTIILAIALNAFFGISQYFNILNINEWLSPIFIGETNLISFYDHSRVVGTLGNPNIFAGVLLIGLSLTLAKLLNKIDLKMTILFFVQFMALIFTQSRTGFVIFFIIIVFIIFNQLIFNSNNFKDMIKNITVIVILPAIIFMLFLLLPTKYFNRIDNLNNISEDLSFNTRLMIWKDTFFNRTMDNIIFGTGPTSNFSITFDNEWLHILTHYGIIGLIFILFFLFIIYRNSKIGIKDFYWITISCRTIILSMVIYMMTASVFHTLQLGPIVMIILALSSVINKNLVNKVG